MSNNQQPKKVFKKIKHKRPISQGSRIPPAMSVPASTEADIKALLAEDTQTQETKTSPAPQNNDEED